MALVPKSFYTFEKIHYRYWNTSFATIEVGDSIEDYTYFHVLQEDDTENKNVFIIRIKKPGEEFITINYLFTYLDSSKNIINPEIKKEQIIYLKDLQRSINIITFNLWIKISNSYIQDKGFLSKEIRLTKRLLLELTLERSLLDKTIYFTVNSLSMIAMGYVIDLYQGIDDKNEEIFDCIEYEFGYFTENGSVKPKDENGEITHVFRSKEEIEKSRDYISNSSQPTLINIDKIQIKLVRPKRVSKRLTDSYLYYRLYENHVYNKEYNYQFHFFCIYYLKDKKRYYLIQINRFALEGDVYGYVILYIEDGKANNVQNFYKFTSKYEFTPFTNLDVDTKNLISETLLKTSFRVFYIPDILITSKSIKNYQKSSVLNRIESSGKPECFFWTLLQTNLNYHINLIEVLKESDDKYRLYNQQFGYIKVNDKTLTFIARTLETFTDDYTKEQFEKSFSMVDDIDKLLDIQDKFSFKYIFPTKNIIQDIAINVKFPEEEKDLPKNILSKKTAPKPLLKIDSNRPIVKTVIERYRDILYHPEIGRREAEILFYHKDKYIFHKILFVNEQEIDGTKFWIIDYENKNNDIRYYNGMYHGLKKYFTFDRRENNKFNRKEWTTFFIRILIMRNRKVIRLYDSKIELGAGSLIEVHSNGTPIPENDTNIITNVDTTENVWSIKKLILKDNKKAFDDTLQPFF